MADLNAILDSIKELKLLEVAELVKMMEDEFGVALLHRLWLQVLLTVLLQAVLKSQNLMLYLQKASSIKAWRNQSC